MKKLFVKSLLLSSASILILGMASCSKVNMQQNNELSDALTQNGQIIKDQYIVVFKKDAINAFSTARTMNYDDGLRAMKSEVASVLRELSIDEALIGNVYARAIPGFSGKLDQIALNKLKNDDRVDYIEQDRLMILGPPPGKGKPGDGGGEEPPPPPAQSIPAGINRVGGSVDATGKTAWIIDTGVDLDHPDLNVDNSRSRTFISRGKDSKNADDGNGHGTHVAGTIAAIDNNIGVVGVAANASVVAVKVLNAQGSGSYSDVIAGVDYVAGAGAAGDAANMSLGGPVSQALDDAVVAASANGVMFGLAAGNETDDANNHSPARANGANIYTISAMDANDVYAYFSNYGNPPVDYCAPGVSILSTWKDGGYNTISGTSMAAPHATAVLLVTGGNPATSGYVSNDPDGSADPVISR